MECTDGSLQDAVDVKGGIPVLVPILPGSSEGGYTGAIPSYRRRREESWFSVVRTVSGGCAGDGSSKDASWRYGSKFEG